MELKKIKVLLVEDVIIAQKVAKMTLERLHCNVFTADTGAQALELFTQHDFDLIFMDLGLEDIDGLTVTETIRKLEGKSQHVPIIALTAHSATENNILDKCLQVGMDDFIQKPLNSEITQLMLNKYIKKPS